MTRAIPSRVSLDVYAHAYGFKSQWNARYHLELRGIDYDRETLTVRVDDVPGLRERLGQSEDTHPEETA